MHNFQWTKDNLRKLLSLWETKTPDEIAIKLGTDRKKINYMAYELRKAGFNIPTKRTNGQLKKMILELKDELTKENEK